MAPKAKEAAKAEAKGKAKAKAKPKVVKEEDGPKMDPPDRTTFEAACAKIEEDIEAFKKEQQALSAKINERSGGKDEYFNKREEYKAQIREFSAKLDELMGRKGEVNKAMGDKKQEGIDMRNQLNKMKKSIGYNSEADIDERIASIEFKMWTDTISLKEEKEYLKEIADLKKNRPKVSQVNKMQDSLATRDTGSNLRENIGSINEEMALYRDGKRQVQEKLTTLNGERKEQLGDLPQYIEQREAIGKKVQEKIQERNALRDEFRQKEKDFNAWKNEQRKARMEKVEEERNAKRAEYDMQKRRAKADELDTQPYISEITLIEQTLLFCKNLVADKGPAKEETKTETKHDNPEGTEVLLRPEDRDEEFYFAPTKKGKKGKAKKGGAKEGGAKPIKHNAETFRLFDQLKLNAPITTEEIPSILEKLEELLEDYQNKVKEWEVNKNEMKQKILAGQADEKEEAAAEEATEEATEE